MLATLSKKGSRTLKLTALLAGLILAVAGCCHPPPVSQAQPILPLSSTEAGAIANIYLIALYGPCGTSSMSVEDGGSFWRVQTVFGLGERPGPELRVDKLSRKVTVAPTQH